MTPYIQVCPFSHRKESYERFAHNHLTSPYLFQALQKVDWVEDSPALCPPLQELESAPLPLSLYPMLQDTDCISASTQQKSCNPEHTRTDRTSSWKPLQDG